MDPHQRPTTPKRADFSIVYKGISILVDPTHSSAYDASRKHSLTPRFLANRLAEAKRKEYQAAYAHNPATFLPAACEADGAICDEFKAILLSQASILKAQQLLPYPNPFTLPK